MAVHVRSIPLGRSQFDRHPNNYISKQHDLPGNHPKESAREVHGAILMDCFKSLGMNAIEDWYEVRGNDLFKISTKAESLLKNYYNSSMITALTSIYPGYDWQVWRFERSPQVSFDLIVGLLNSI